MRRGWPRGARGAGHESLPCRAAIADPEVDFGIGARHSCFRRSTGSHLSRVIAIGRPTDEVRETRGNDALHFPCPGGWPRPDRSLDDVRRIGDGRAVRPGLRAGPSVANETPRAAESSRIVAEVPWRTLRRRSRSSRSLQVRLCLTVFHSCSAFRPPSRSPSSSRASGTARPARLPTNDRGWTFHGPEAVNTSNSTTRNLNQPAGFVGFQTGQRARARD